jgi:glyoxylase-like metal-dependent hydrolase (beta-lactamase superfamily II)
MADGRWLMASNHFVERFITSGGAQIFSLPLEAFPRFWAYSYLVFVNDMRVLIDTGSGSEASYKSLEAALEGVGQEFGVAVKLEDLTHILITHGHIDHFGGLVRLRERTGAMIGVHELDQHTLTHHEERLALMSRWLEDYLAEAGIPDGERARLLEMYKFTKVVYHSMPVDFTYETAGMRLDPFEMIHIPGHCPGHVAIRLHDIVFSGDHVLENIIPHQAPERIIQYMGLGHYLESLTKLERWAADARLVLNGHDAPIKRLSTRIGFIRLSLDSRLRQTMKYLSEPHTIAEITAHQYPDINGYNGLLVLEKTGAFVEYLYQRGLLEITNLDELEKEETPAIRYCQMKHNANSVLFSCRTSI